MMAASIRTREKCQGCSKNILAHNKIVICQKCPKILHAKCAHKLFNYDHISDIWHCWECTSTSQEIYNPFRSLQYDKHVQDDSEALEEINQICQILDNCLIYDYNQLDKIINKSTNSTSLPFSMLFNNIDGMTSNFDKFRLILTISYLILGIILMSDFDNLVISDF